MRFLDYARNDITTFKVAVNAQVTSLAVERSNPFIFFNSLRFLDYAQNDISYVLSDDSKGYEISIINKS